MRLLHLLEDADDEIISRLKAMARRDVVPLFDPRFKDLPNDRMRAFLSPDGRIVAAWPAFAMTHAEIGDYHGGRMDTVSPLARNIYNCVILYPPGRFSNGWRVGNDNLASNRPMPLEEYINLYGSKMAKYSSSMVTEDDEITAWFGSSKVVDANGNPLKVYHGTAREFDGFSLDADPMHRRIPGKSDLELNGIYFTADPRAAAGYAAFAKRKQGHGRPRSIAAYLRMVSPLDITAAVRRYRRNGMAFGDAKRRALQDLDRSMHDGVIFSGDGANPAEYIVFEPSQIKVAHG